MAFFMNTDARLWMNFLLFAAYLERLSSDCGTFVILEDANKYSLLFIKGSYWIFEQISASVWGYFSAMA